MTHGRWHGWLRWLAGTAAIIGMSGAAQAAPGNGDLMAAIAREIVDCGELDGIAWQEVSAVFAVDEDGDVNQSYGYAYDADARRMPSPFSMTRSSARSGATANGCARGTTRVSSRCCSSSTGSRARSTPNSNTTTRRAGR